MMRRGTPITFVPVQANVEATLSVISMIISIWSQLIALIQQAIDFLHDPE